MLGNSNHTVGAIIEHTVCLSWWGTILNYFIVTSTRYIWLNLWRADPEKMSWLQPTEVWDYNSECTARYSRRNYIIARLLSVQRINTKSESISKTTWSVTLMWTSQPASTHKRSSSFFGGIRIRHVSLIDWGREPVRGSITCALITQRISLYLSVPSILPSIYSSTNSITLSWSKRLSTWSSGPLFFTPLTTQKHKIAARRVLRKLLDRMWRPTSSHNTIFQLRATLLQ